jgi:hypothetical protein
MGLTVSSAVAQEVSPAVEADQQVAPPIARLPDTLMFSIDEVQDIQARVAATQAALEGASGQRRTESIENASLYLSTIVYYGPQDWTIWINGRPITPGAEFESFQITSISPEAVELLVPLSAQGMRPVTLSPNQSFIVKSGTIVEGPWK